MSIFDPRTWFQNKPVQVHNEAPKKKRPPKEVAIPPGRVSEPETPPGGYLVSLRHMTQMITPSFRTELIPIIRDLYKINPDVSIALQDMFKLANTGHNISFPNNTPEESEKMRDHLSQASKNWTRYTAGIDGLVNKMLVQLLVGGAISIEAVPNRDLSGLATILFLKPESILFRRLGNGVYHPYQKNPMPIGRKNLKNMYIKLNTETYKYIGMYNDTDEPYGVPPFLSSLDSITGQHNMWENFKHIMEQMGMMGFLEAKMAKPMRRASESDAAYAARLRSNLIRLKKNLKDGMRDGIVTGYIDDHEFELNSTTKDLNNIDKPWSMNQQRVANGLGVNGTIIGVQSTTTEGGAGVLLSKMLSQLKNLQMILAFALEFIYSLELRLAGFDNKGLKVVFNTTTVSDEVKVQQGLEYKIKNLSTLYAQGIIGQEQFAWEMGYNKPAEKKPREEFLDPGSTPSAQDIKDNERKKDKEASDRKGRDKNNPTPKRHDQDTRRR